MNIWGVTDKGVVRQQNQDDFHIELTQPDVALGIVCDGMGGARAGNVASRLAVDTFLDTGRPRGSAQLWGGTGQPGSPLPRGYRRGVPGNGDHHGGRAGHRGNGLSP